MEGCPMRVRGLGVVLTVVLVLRIVPLEAHHTWVSVFSEEKPVVLRGTLAKVELVNPHSWIYVDVKNPDGTVSRWAVEGGPPNGLVRNGVTKASFTVGEPIVVYGYGARDNSNQVAGVKFERTDGKQFFLANDGVQAVAESRGNLK
jgi:hypothetical protein